MNVISARFIDCVKSIEKKSVFMAITLTLAIGYYINPLGNVDVTSWNRTFCSAVMNGISIDARIGNFYKLFFLYFPLIFIATLVVLTVLFKYRNSYSDIFLKFGFFFAIGTFVSYISRYTSDASEINGNPLIQGLLAYFILLCVIAFLDKNQKLTFKDHVWIFLSFLMSITTCSMLFHAENNMAYIIIVGVLICCTAFFLYVPSAKIVFPVFRNYLYALMWLPALIRGALEGIYFLTEKGRGIERYYTHISRTVLLIIIVTFIIVWLVRKKNLKFSGLGYIGAIVSFAVISQFAYSYPIFMSMEIRL